MQPTSLFRLQIVSDQRLRVLDAFSDLQLILDKTLKFRTRITHDFRYDIITAEDLVELLNLLKTPQRVRSELELAMTTMNKDIR